jgi:hypothetical protein
MALAADKVRRVRGRMQAAFEVADTVQVFGGGYAALRGPTFATAGDRGRAGPWSKTAGEIPLGGGAHHGALGSITDDVPPDSRQHVDGVVWENVSVTGVAALGDTGKLVYLTDDDVLTLTRAAPDLPLGLVIRHLTGALADVYLFSLGELVAIALGGAGVEVMNLGSYDVTIAASANLATGMEMPYRATITSVYAIIDTTLVGAAGDVAINLEINGVNVTGGVVPLLIASPTQGTKVAGTAITALNEVSQGDLLDIEALVTTVFTAGRVNLYATLERKPGL